jgi:hypothetical protein
MSASGRAVLILLLAGLALAPAACSDDGGGDDVADDGGDAHDDDAAADDGDEPEWGPECEVDIDCNDDVDCTVDVCDRGLCRNTPDDAPCQDDQVCNGHEVCYPREGCGPGEPFRGCNDADACTMDRCVEPEPGMAPTCEYLPLDRDSDTHVDSRCGGDDCNDIDPLSNPDAQERCFDTFDNDCDGFTDALDTDCQMSFDNCTTPHPLVPGVEWEGFTSGATADVATSCDPSSYRDAVFSFQVTEPSDALISVNGRGVYTYVALQTTCGDTASELRCLSSTNVSIFKRALAPGTYFIVVSGWNSSVVPATDEITFLIRVDLTPAGAPPPGDTCDSPIPLTLPAHQEADVTRMDDDIALPCAWGDNADVVYSFTLTEPQDVTIDVASPSLTMYAALQDACTGGTTLVCDYGWPFHRTIGNVPAGTYYLWVEASGAGRYSVDVSSTAPTPPPANDTCTGAIDISAGGHFEGSLLSSLDDYTATCTGASREVAYVLTITEQKLVSVVLTAHYDLYPYMVVTTECGNTAAQLLCQWYEYPTTVDWRLLEPGTYYFLVECSEEGTFALDVTIGDPVDPCAGLETISASGSWSGTTAGMFDDVAGTCGGSGGLDVTYEVQIAAPSRFVAEIGPSATWDTVLHLRSVCTDQATQLACNDDYTGIGLRSHIEVASLAAGTYYLNVDGLYSGASGPYTVNVTITPL